MSDRLLSVELLEEIEKKADNLEGVVACMQSSTYTAAFLAAQAQDKISYAAGCKDTAREIVDIVKDWLLLMEQGHDKEFLKKYSWYKYGDGLANNLKSKYNL